MTPASQKTIRCRPDHHTAGCVLCSIQVDRATTIAQTEEMLAEWVAWKPGHSLGMVNHLALPSVWQMICCALALWRWIKCPHESPARLVTVHSTRSLPLPSSCVISSSPLSLPAHIDEISYFRGDAQFKLKLKMNSFRTSRLASLKILQF